MKSSKKNNDSKSIPFNTKYISYKNLAISILKTGSICISYTEGEPNSIWGFYLYDSQTKLFIWDSRNKTIFDDLVEKADESLFRHGNKFSKILVPQDLESTVFEKSFFQIVNKEILKRSFYNGNDNDLKTKKRRSNK